MVTKQPFFALHLKSDLRTTGPSFARTASARPHVRAPIGLQLPLLNMKRHAVFGDKRDFKTLCVAPFAPRVVKHVVQKFCFPFASFTTAQLLVSEHRHPRVSNAKFC